jgi:hypothetical protein
MAKATSPTGGQPYGIQRVGQAWGHAALQRRRRPGAGTGHRHPASAPARRGPKPAVTDQALLAAIRSGLETSPWTGEGHRKVWARLRVRDAIRVSAKRVLRLMREHTLLSPHRPRRRPDEAHRRQIITAAPHVMWAIDATQAATVQHGKVWIFVSGV